MKILVSACLMGIYCRYNGETKPCEAVTALAQRHTLIPVCPEQLGGLPTPRPPAEQLENRVLCKDGTDVTKAFVRGAEEVLKIARLTGCTVAVLKERSPSCGSGVIYNGQFNGGLIPGDGICAALLKENGITVYGETDAALLQL